MLLFLFGVVVGIVTTIVLLLAVLRIIAKKSDKVLGDLLSELSNR